MFPVPGNFGGTQLGNYAMEIIEMTLESAWIYEIHHFPLKFVSIYRKKKRKLWQLHISWQLYPFWPLKLQLPVT